ncbi:MAG: tail fiber domain-containing protein [bacterium]|nr:tail fiber domain-containing protein [bacterium]
MTTIITKNGSGAPTAGQLSEGELAVDLTNKELYTKSGSTVIKIGSQGGSSGTFTDLTATSSFTSPGIDDNATSTQLTVTNAGIAATLTTAAQPNITSVGTLTGFTSTGIDDNATSTAITIDANKNVGIGTAPSAAGSRLQVSGNAYFTGWTTGQSHFIANGQAGAFGANGSTRMEVFDTPTQKQLAFYAGTGLVSTFNSDGNATFSSNVSAAKLQAEVVGAALYQTFTLNGKAQPHYGINWSTGDGAGNIVPVGISGFYGIDFATGGVSRAVISSSTGNVGIGTQSPTWPLHVSGLNANGIMASGANPQVQLSSSGAPNTAPQFGFQALATTPGAFFGNSAVGDYVISAHSGSLLLGTGGGAERMRITSAGNVGIGTVNPTNSFNYSTLDVRNTTGGQIVLGRTGAIDGYVYTEAGFMNVAAHTGNALRFLSNAAGNVGNSMTLDTAGNLLLGTTAPAARLAVVQPAGADREVFLAGIESISNGLHVRYISGAMHYTLNGLGTGTVSSAGGVLSASSDQNMKIADGCVDNALDKISALTPRYFYWKDKDGNSDIDKGRQLGFFAQEVNKVVPEAAPEPKDDQNGWGVLDRSLVATLVKATQEQQAMIETLQAEVAALKGA